MQGHIPARHHRLLIEQLEAVSAGKINRLMIFMPPGSAKSTYTSVDFPPWYLGQHPAANIIGVSNTADNAKRFGRKVRNLVRGEDYRATFGFGLSRDSTRADQWETERGGEYFAAGVEGTVTSRRADLALIDDPIKGRADADSATTRERTWEWYKGDLLTRLKPNGAIIIIQTRWHKDDLSGRILPEAWNGESGWITSRDGERWYVLCLPAIAVNDNDPLGRAPGEPLWPEWQSKAKLEQMRRSQGERNWNSLYQQVPTDAAGLIFLREWWRIWSAQKLPVPLKILLSFDTAYKTGQDNDYSACTVWGVFDLPAEDTDQARDAGKPRRCVILLDAWRDKLKYPELRERAKAEVEKWTTRDEDTGAEIPPDYIVIEDKGSGQSLIQDLDDAGISVFAYNPGRDDKQLRAHVVSPLFRDGLVYVPGRKVDGVRLPNEPAKWAGKVINECAEFPRGSHDDYVDTVTQVLALLKDLGELIISSDPGADDPDDEDAEQQQSRSPYAA